MNWVTWTDIGVDRMACAWLITRVLDPAPTFVFVAAGTAPLPADAEPFDIPGVRLSHYRGHCSFHTMLRIYALSDPVLARIARLVDEADVVQEAPVEPAAPGLDLLCRGLRRISPDDQRALEHGLVLYDALYAELAAELGHPLPAPLPAPIDPASLRPARTQED
jgi:hypothetical protein